MSDEGKATYWPGSFRSSSGCKCNRASGSPPGDSYCRGSMEARAGIFGSSTQGADSIVLSGGYKDDEDHGDIIVYSGYGGRDPATEGCVRRGRRGGAWLRPRRGSAATVGIS